MDSRTLIKKVIEFDNAERIGMNFDEGYPDDFVYCDIKRRTDFDYAWHKPQDFLSLYPEIRNFHGYVRRDEFGNLWGKMLHDPSSQGEVLFGVLQDWDSLDTYEFPRLSDPKRFEHIECELEQNKGKFRVGGLPGFPFAIMRYMRKMENFLVDIVMEKEKVNRLNELVVNELIKIIDNFAEAGMDAVMFCEDWGTQDRLLISPRLWREMFKPSFKALCSRAHSRNMYVIMHSCGYIYEILEDLLEIGVNVFQLDQPTLMGIDRIAPIFHKRAALFSPVNIQVTLPTGDRELIVKEARDLVRKFFHDGGGFIAKDYGDYATIMVKNEWACWMRDAFIKYGVHGATQICYKK
jgi:hypothetical protein